MGDVQSRLPMSAPPILVPRQKSGIVVNADFHAPDMNQGSHASTYFDWLARSISQYEAVAKSIVPHHGEKGRIVEGVVKSALRAVLPIRFSIGTGFVITSSGKMSPQLDLVIYDALFNAPIVLEGGTGLFPIECVFGAVEVKSALDAAEIDKSTRAISAIRSLAPEKRYVHYVPAAAGDGKYVVQELEIPSDLAPRTFVFAVTSELTKETIIEKLKVATERDQAHVHGLLALDKNLFIYQRPHRQTHEFASVEERAFSEFCARVASSVQSMPIFPASMRRYFGSE